MFVGLREERPDLSLPYRGLANVAWYEGRVDEIRENALATLERKRTPWDSFWSSLPLLQVREERPQAVGLMKQIHAEMSDEAVPALFLSILLEGDDPTESARVLQRAEQLWIRSDEGKQAVRRWFEKHSVGRPSNREGGPGT